MNRRRFIAGSAAAMGATMPLTGPLRLAAAAAEKQNPAPVPANDSFEAGMVRAIAKDLASKSYKQADMSLPQGFTDLSYDQYRAVRFKPDRAVWRDEKLPFQLQFFHRGFIFKDRIDVYEVSGGKAKLIPYAPDLFDFGALKPPPADSNPGFAGFRMHAALNRNDYFDEVGVFLGASYFRAVAKGQTYGLSARGLSIRTADQKGEEFPSFRTFWIEKPALHANSLVVHALLDSPSAAAAYRFTIRPGETTIFDTEMSLYPRTDIDQPGIGTGTSMFFFDANDHASVDDFRPGVHDSDGLSMRNGRNEEIWRGLTNPRDLQVSTFSDTNPRGFGLLQRERDFFAYEDLESHFEKRPSLWVEPIGDWGEGAVMLVEIPTREEIHDNITAFWRPKDALKAKGEYSYTYRMHWGQEYENARKLAQFVKTRTGAGPDNTRRFVIEALGKAVNGIDPAKLKAVVSADKGEIRNLVLQENIATGGLRISFELDTRKQPVVEMRGQIMQGDEPATEVWIYRWTA